MKADKYSRKVTLKCPTCGNIELDTNDEDQDIIKCPSCERIMTKQELINENGENIENNIEEMKDEVIKDVEKELNNMFKNAFKGSKNIRIK